MKKILLLLLPLFLACNNSQKEEPENLETEQNESTDQVTTYYFIRHAEKDRSNPEEKDPVLTKAGEKRARNWAEVFKDVDLDMIYSSDFKRTKATAKPTAKAKGLKLKIYDTSNLNDQDFQEQTAGKTVLVVGHSNTTPQFVNLILGEEKYENIADDENGALFIVKELSDGKKTSQVLYIN
ncbi:SixA phosphatase family protein [Salegentibacter chungangensis]|uniref:SixA phosphatase family protein n=1 Tax=Salegentibacter chungangensis TaxID=1335724 RepID=A0ABW3NNN5_9FLAO